VKDVNGRTAGRTTEKHNAFTAYCWLGRKKIVGNIEAFEVNAVLPQINENAVF